MIIVMVIVMLILMMIIFVMIITIIMTIITVMMIAKVSPPRSREYRGRILARPGAMDCPGRGKPDYPLLGR